jgi:hypothetical protein
MRRAFFAILGTVAAIFCLATAVLWVQSGWPQREYRLESNRGLTTIHLLPSQNPAGLHHRSISLQSIDPFLVRKPDAWFEFDAPFWMLSMPDWVLFLGFAFASGACFRLRGRKYPVGSCAQCGYDLRASRYHCPECGKIIND